MLLTARRASKTRAKGKKKRAKQKNKEKCYLIAVLSRNTFPGGSQAA